MATTQAKILNGAALSGVIDLRGQVLTAIMYPAAWTAADLSIQMSNDGITFGEVFNDPGNGTGAAVALDAAAGQVSILSGIYIGDCYIKIRSGPSGVPVNQGADRAIVLFTRPLG